ncbi:MAG TPA: glycosyltransferase [Nocardioides sp.]|nr:glycosyltransferase [Nocardioides sp.]
MAEARQLGDRPRVSVVIPCFRAALELPRCLASLAAQTLPTTDFEVVLVLNGTDDGALDAEGGIRVAWPSLRIRIVRSGQAGAGHARNLGVAAAIGEHVTFVDHDDYVSPDYLAVLLDLAQPGVVPLAQVADVAVASDGGHGVPDRDNYLGAWFGPLAGQTVAVGSNPRGAGFNVGKLLPLEIARQIRFDESLRSGEDVIYWMDVVRRVRFRWAVADERATYFRVLRGDSVSRRDASYDFGVTQRLDVLARITDKTTTGDARTARRVRNAFVSAQSRQLADHLAAHPEQRDRALAEIADRQLAEHVLWTQLNGPAEDLAILYAFLPFADTSALVASRRLRARGEVTDVLSNDLSSMRGRDMANWRLVERVLSRHHAVGAPATAFNWAAIRDFDQRGLRIVEKWIEERGRPYRSVYSRAMLPAAHVLAARVKLRHPQTHWLAEFSDPMVFNPYGERRLSAAADDRLWKELSGAMEAAGVVPPADRNVPDLIELIAYALADEILFTNRNQMEFMLARVDPAVAESVRSRARYEHHPVPDPALYEVAHRDYDLDPGRVNVAYFGAFYATRGLTEVVEALTSLAQQDRARIAFHVFTSDPETLAEQVNARCLGDVIRVNGHVPYLECLNLATRMDVLLINDARTRQHYEVNPYLPSKWSDYSGSGTPIWALVEPGSILDEMQVAHRTMLGDAAGVRAVFEKLAAGGRGA